MKTKTEKEQRKSSEICLELLGKDKDIVYYEEIKKLFDYFVSEGYKVYFKKMFSNWAIIIRK